MTANTTEKWEGGIHPDVTGVIGPDFISVIWEIAYVKFLFGYISIRKRKYFESAGAAGTQGQHDTSLSPVAFPRGQSGEALQAGPYSKGHAVSGAF